MKTPEMSQLTAVTYSVTVIHNVYWVLTISRLCVYSTICVYSLYILPAVWSVQVTVDLNTLNKQKQVHTVVYNTCAQC